PNDPVGLTDRGELRLSRGDLKGAVEDLRLALKNDPPQEVRPRTEELLFEARLAQAAELVQAQKYDEADRLLQEVRRAEKEPQRAARVVEQLALLETRRGRLPEAVRYYRILGKDFAKVRVRDGKTGADLFQDLQTDKRFLPYLQEPPP